MSLSILKLVASTKSIYKKEVRERFKQPIGETGIITETDLSKLPVPVAKYLSYCGKYCTLATPLHCPFTKAANLLSVLVEIILLIRTWPIIFIVLVKALVFTDQLAGASAYTFSFIFNFSG